MDWNCRAWPTHFRLKNLLVDLSCFPPSCLKKGCLLALCGWLPHKAGNQLDLIFTRSCGTSALCHPVSDHHFVAFSLPLKSSPSLLSTPHSVTSCCNLKSLSPSTFASTVLSLLPSVEQFSQLSTHEASDTMLSSLSSSLCHAGTGIEPDSDAEVVSKVKF